MRDEDQTHNYAPQPTSFPNHHTVVGETPHSTHNTLANSNLHQPLISFLCVNNIEKMYKHAKYEISLYYYKYLI